MQILVFAIITSITTKAIELGDEQTTEIPLNEPEASGQEEETCQTTQDPCPNNETASMTILHQRLMNELYDKLTKQLDKAIHTKIEPVPDSWTPVPFRKTTQYLSLIKPDQFSKAAITCVHQKKGRVYSVQGYSIEDLKQLGNYLKKTRYRSFL